jgi:hypothetical protein
MNQAIKAQMTSIPKHKMPIGTPSIHEPTAAKGMHKISISRIIALSSREISSPIAGSPAGISKSAVDRAMLR